MNPTRIETYRDTTGEWRFRIVAGNGEIIADSEGYSRHQDMLDTIDTLRATLHDATLDDPHKE